MNVALKKMTVAEFLDWAEAQPEGRFELVDGQVVAMVQERALHNLAKMEVTRALQDGVNAAGLPCTVYTDGMMVEIDEHGARGPDAILTCGQPIDYDAMIVENPLVLVEVVSPTSETRDTDSKLVEYFLIPSVQHYLIFFPHKGVVVHHARSIGGGVATEFFYGGVIALNPPGLLLSVDRVLELGRR